MLQKLLLGQRGAGRGRSCPSSPHPKPRDSLPRPSAPQMLAAAKGSCVKAASPPALHSSDLAQLPAPFPTQGPLFLSFPSFASRRLSCLSRGPESPPHFPLLGCLRNLPGPFWDLISPGRNRQLQLRMAASAQQGSVFPCALGASSGSLGHCRGRLLKSGSCCYYFVYIDFLFKCWGPVGACLMARMMKMKRARMAAPDLLL